MKCDCSWKALKCPALKSLDYCLTNLPPCNSLVLPWVLGYLSAKNGNKVCLRPSVEVKQWMYVSPHALHYDCLPTFRHLLGIWVLNLAQGDARSSASLCVHKEWTCQAVLQWRFSQWGYMCAVHINPSCWGSQLWGDFIELPENNLCLFSSMRPWIPIIACGRNCLRIFISISIDVHVCISGRLYVTCVRMCAEAKRGYSVS